MSKSELTIKQATGSLSGWDIIAIEKQTKTKFADLSGMDLARSVMWTVERRSNSGYTWNNALDATLDDLNEYFTAEDDADPLPQEKPNTN